MLSALSDILNFKFREPEYYGPVILSIQASRGHYCEPRVDGLPLDKYESVEVGFRFKYSLAKPSAAGIHGFDRLFQKGDAPVAENVSQADVAKLRAAVKAIWGDEQPNQSKRARR